MNMYEAKELTTSVEKETTIKEIEKIAHEHHTSWARGYISRRTGGVLMKYEGKFGKGFVLHEPSWRSTFYHHVTYYIFKEVV